MDSLPPPDSEQTIDVAAVRDSDAEELLRWIRTSKPFRLNDHDAEKFLAADISGFVFLEGDSRKEIFEKAGLSVGACVKLEALAKKIIDRKSKLLSFMSCTPRSQQANNLTGNRQQAEDVEMSDAADMMRKLLSFIPCTPRRQLTTSQARGE
jgi:hypothetical protein